MKEAAAQTERVIPLQCLLNQRHSFGLGLRSGANSERKTSNNLHMGLLFAFESVLASDLHSAGATHRFTKKTHWIHPDSRTVDISREDPTTPSPE